MTSRVGSTRSAGSPSASCVDQRNTRNGLAVVSGQRRQRERELQQRPALQGHLAAALSSDARMGRHRLVVCAMRTHDGNRRRSMRSPWIAIIAP